MDKTKRSQIREANFYFFLEAAIALFVSFLINLFVVSVFAEGFYNRNNTQIVSFNQLFAVNPNKKLLIHLPKIASFDT